MDNLGFQELIVMCIILSIILGSVIASVFYLLTIGRALKLTQKYHQIAPGLVWLLLIPIFSLGWNFYILNRTTMGIKGKYAELGKDCADAGWNIGLAFSILACCSIIFGFIPLVGTLIGLATFTTWIMYWVKIAGYNRLMV